MGLFGCFGWDRRAEDLVRVHNNNNSSSSSSSSSFSNVGAFTGTCSAPNHGGPPRWQAAGVQQQRSCTRQDPAPRDAEELLARATLSDESSLPLVSLASLQAAFHHAPQAIAVVKLSQRATLQPKTPRASIDLRITSPTPWIGQRQTPEPSGPFATSTTAIPLALAAGKAAAAAAAALAAAGAELPAGHAGGTHGIPRPPPPSTSACPVGLERAGAQLVAHARRDKHCSFNVPASPTTPPDGSLPEAALLPLPVDVLQKKLGPGAGCASKRRSENGTTCWSPSQQAPGLDEAGVQRLEPVFLTAPLKRMLHVADRAEFSYVMERQLLRNPMLVMLFENVVGQLLQGRATVVQQHVPHFANRSSRGLPADNPHFINLNIAACALQERDGGSSSSRCGSSSRRGSSSSCEGDAVGKATPALLLWYDLPSSQAEITSQLKRDFMALSHIPSMVTVLALDGRVLYQNGCSVAYLGFVMGSKRSAGTNIKDPQHTLRRLFVMEPEALEDMLSSLSDTRALSDKTWHALVQMPAHVDLAEPGVPAAWRSTEGLAASLPLKARSCKAAREREQRAFTDSARCTDDQPGTGQPPPRRDSSSLHSSGPNAARRAPAATPASTRAAPDGAAAPRGNRRLSWRVSGKPLLEACQQLVLGARCSVGGPSDSSSSRSTASRRSSHAQQDSRAVQLAQQYLLRQEAAPAGDSAVQWHQIQASKFQDPVTGEDVIMLIQTDVSARVRAEQLLHSMLDAEHRLLESIFPRQVLEAMTTAAVHTTMAGPTEQPMGRGVAAAQPHPTLLADQMRDMAQHHEQVTVLFADIVGFTTMAKQVAPQAVMAFLNDLYTRFDALLSEHQVYKVETIGDCYMVAGGLVFTDAQGYTSVEQRVDPHHATKVFGFAKAMLRMAGQVTLPDTGLPVQLRVGIHSGPVVSGVVGTRMPRFCLFGDTVNTANRMESTAAPNSIHVSDVTHQLIGGEGWEPTGGVQLKGRGAMKSYLYKAAQPVAASASAAAAAAAPTPASPLPSL